MRCACSRHAKACKDAHACRVSEHLIGYLLRIYQFVKIRTHTHAYCTHIAYFMPCSSACCSTPHAQHGCASCIHRFGRQNNINAARATIVAQNVSGANVSRVTFCEHTHTDTHTNKLMLHAALPTSRAPSAQRTVQRLGRERGEHRCK